MTRTYADPFGTIATSGDELALRLCDLVGVDPGATTTISLEAESGLGAVIRWSGVKRVPLADVARALDPKDDDAATPATPTCGVQAAGVLPNSVVGPCVLERGHPDDEPHLDRNGASWRVRPGDVEDGEPFPARCTYVSQTTGQRCTRNEHADDPHSFPPAPAPYHGET